jgi:hypothetical protein
MTLACARARRLVVHLRVELARRAPERRQRRAVAGQVPDARRDDAARRRHARHLAQACDGIAHEVDDELREGNVEAGVRKRQLLGSGPADVDAGVAFARRLHERLGRVDGGDLLGAEPRDEFARKRARPAADVERAHPGTDTGEVCELRCELHRITAHEPVVRLGRDGERHSSMRT